jgi:hypothetical protein
MPILKQGRKAPPKEPEPDPYELSYLSTRAVDYTRWSSWDFVVAAGLYILQPSTSRVVLVSTGEQGPKGARLFLPRGRKDIGKA